MRGRILVALGVLLLAAVLWRVVAGRMEAAPAGRPGAAVAPAALNDVRGHPNVVLISLDTLRPDHLGCYGYGRATSPNLDAFAAGAVRFSNAHAQAPFTLASHMSLLTSMRPSRNGVFTFATALPEQVRTLAQVLQSQGYNTAALVNDGQMTAHWGFDRGFSLWQEFPVGTEEGSCDHIADEAVAWLGRERVQEGDLRGGPPGGAGRRPFFLFLHFYDAHDPYDPPPAYKRAMGSMLTRAECEGLLRQYHFPESGMPDAQALARLVLAYDSQVPWLDQAVGRVLRAVPAETLVVIFSDHGEGFKEHGWLEHESTLYEETTRVVLLIRPAASGPAGTQPSSAVRVVDEPVALLDVAPTILAQCNVAAPAEFEGADLTGAMRGEHLPARLIPAETMGFEKGVMTRSLIHWPWKLIYGVLDGRAELYRLPDEQRDLAGSEPGVVQAMLKPMKEWLASEDFWVIDAKGPGVKDVTVLLPGGQFVDVYPVDPGPGDGFTMKLPPESRSPVFYWHVRPGAGGEGTRRIFFHVDPPESAIGADFRIDGVRVADRVWVGKGRASPAGLPVEVHPPGDRLVSKGSLPGRIDLTEETVLHGDGDLRAWLDRDGFAISKVQGMSRGRAGQYKGLDARTREQLETLNYLSGPAKGPATRKGETGDGPGAGR